MTPEICPNCGAEVPRQAKACPECGSDEKTGWSEEAHAGDWPQFLGPTRNGAYPGTDLASTWPKDGPPLLWQKKVGQGFSGPVVSSEKLILFHRLENKETIECLEAN